MEQLAIAIVVAGFVVVAAMLLMRRGPATTGRPEKVPPALRPGDTDDVLESDRLTKVMRAGFALSLFFAVFLPVYWFAEPGRMQGKEERFDEESIERGAKYYAMRADPVTGEPNLSGVECARCHGVDLTGGENTFLDPATGKQRTVRVPDLVGVFKRYEKPPPGYKDAQEFVQATIERGRTDGVLGVAADMPNWSNRFGGPLTEQQVEDIINYLKSVQKEVQVEEGASGEKIFATFCSSCHGTAGTGGVGPAMTGGSEAKVFPSVEDHIAFIKSGSKPGQPYGTTGKGTGGMPPWEGRLSDEEIRLVVEYERSL